ncbi:hypothetical protein MANES_06G026460v8 [Manihot esculenta]|uniref:Uncharacterized protein n=1 Tax=Manihot esculenta TaxID=3983 RepID=A0ACB7HIR3_MANES|nr:hypothetical protein MANES_06G026460v8 [Manihot esculenta]
MELEEMIRKLEISGKILQQQVNQAVNSVNAHILRREEELQDLWDDDETLAAIPAEFVTRTSCKIVEPATTQLALVEAFASQETAPAVKNIEFVAITLSTHTVQTFEAKTATTVEPTKAPAAESVQSDASLVAVQATETRTATAVNNSEPATFPAQPVAEPAESEIYTAEIAPAVQKSATNLESTIKSATTPSNRTATAPAAEFSALADFSAPAYFSAPADFADAPVAEFSALADFSAPADFAAALAVEFSAPANSPTAVFAQTPADMAEYNM